MQPDAIPDHPNRALRVWGWMSEAEVEWLQAQASMMTSVAEIGALHGRSSTALLEGCPGPVYCIDPWNDPDGYSYPSFMRSCGHYDNLVAVQGYSPQVIESHQIPDVDMVFIDGDHKAASVRADIEGWLPRTRRLMAGHDFIEGGGFPDVFTVVTEIFGDKVQVAESTAIWFVDLSAPAPAQKRTRARTKK